MKTRKARKPVVRQFGAPQRQRLETEYDFYRPDYAPLKPSTVAWWRDPFTWVVVGGILCGIAATWLFIYFAEIYRG